MCDSAPIPPVSALPALLVDPTPFCGSGEFSEPVVALHDPRGFSRPLQHFPVYQSAGVLAEADQTNAANWVNGDDAVVLRKGTTIIDVIGQIGASARLSARPV